MDIDLSGTERTPRASTSRIKPLSDPNPGPSNLHDVVLDYISNMGYYQTAQKLAKVNKSRPPDGNGNGTGESDVDMRDNAEGSSSARGGGRAGFDEEALESIERRYNIINHILNGAIVKAIDDLKTHYPAVLSLSHSDSANTGSNGHTGSTNGHANGASTTSKTDNNLWSASQSSAQLLSGARSTNGHNLSHAVAPTNGRPIIAPTNSNTTTVNVNTTTTNDPTNHTTPTFQESLYPPHILLNLHIQDFIESFRLLNPDSSPSSSMTSSITSFNASQSLGMSMSMSMSGSQGIGNGNGNGSGTGSLQQALAAAGGLHAEAGKLEPSDRAVYVREITEAGALFAYTDPESSPVGGFLKQERRIQLARQVNRAILHSQGQATESLLERIARRTTATYNILDQRNIDSRPPWSGTEGPERQQLAKWWKTHNKKFRLADFVLHGYN